MFYANTARSVRLLPRSTVRRAPEALSLRINDGRAYASDTSVHTLVLCGHTQRFSFYANTSARGRSHNPPCMYFIRYAYYGRR